MNCISLDVLSFRSRYLCTIRNFFNKRNFLEIDTPKLKKVPGMEPYLDPFSVFSPNQEEKGYLVTSPEYSLKQCISAGAEKIYEIAHVYRSGEKGRFHTAEFLMLEFYETGKDEFALMQTCIDLFETLENNFQSFGFKRENAEIISMENLFRKYLGCGYETDELISVLAKTEQDSAKYSSYSYDDLFFLVFLNHIEPRLTEGPFFVHSYPRELASLAKTEGRIARRFEIYWKNVEIGNAFYELNEMQEQRKRFEEEQEQRRALGKEVFPLDESFLESLKNLPECSGISIGLDRLFMICMNHDSLKLLSPYANQLG
ncbi:MAG TPA: EF-P lysine aminoacylase EpmA [Leptospiraceae bacterium]|nr:EF-P lysine aminoacylase EpmA [Leptospiraceae bacterium]